MKMCSGPRMQLGEWLRLRCLQGGTATSHLQTHRTHHPHADLSSGYATSARPVPTQKHSYGIKVLTQQCHLG